MNYQTAEFLLSAYELKDLPPDSGAEVAFAGRSNAGKSSALNRLTRQKGLARTSKTPGRTQMINLFALEGKNARLVDLPGYGYAKVPHSVKEHWQKVLAEYLYERQCLRGLILLMDIRHPLKELDYQMVQWGVQNQVPVHILLTKADKLSHSAAMRVLKDVEVALKDFEVPVSLQLFSATAGTGLDALEKQLALWF